MECKKLVEEIIEIIKQIENPVILFKILTVANTHLEILNEKERES